MKIYTQNGIIEREADTIQKLIAAFDDLTIKPLYLNHISNNINFWGQDNSDKINDEYHYELVAFSLEENRNSEAWGTHFGPMTHIHRLDGTYLDKPNYSDITAEAIDYWEFRCNEVSHPTIKLQYMGLVYTFKNRVTNKKCSDQFLEDYIKTIIEASKSGYELDTFAVSNHLPIAFDIAKLYPTLLPLVKAEYLRLTMNAPFPHVGVWMAYFDLMLDHMEERKCFTAEERKKLVYIIVQRFDSLSSFDVNGKGDNKLNPFFVKDVALKLATYYKRVNDYTNKVKVLEEIERSFRAIMPQGTIEQQFFWLIYIQRCYLMFGMNDKVKSLYPEIQSKGSELRKVLTPTSEIYTVPKDAVDLLIQQICSGSEDDIYSNFVNKLVPKKKDAENFVQHQIMNPLSSFMGIQQLSENGMPLSQIGTPEMDPEGNEFAFCARFMEKEEPIMRTVVEHLINKSIFSKDKLVDHIMRSQLIDIDRRSIIEQGVHFYLDGNSIVACHLLIPQIERAISNIAIRKGAQAIRLQPSGKGFMLQLMDKLFDVEEVKKALGENQTFYLRTLLTEQRGMNLRNLLCHGLINPMYFTMGKADRIIHALLLIGLVKI